MKSPLWSIIKDDNDLNRRNNKDINNNNNKILIIVNIVDLKMIPYIETDMIIEGLIMGYGIYDKNDTVIMIIIIIE